MKLRKRLNKLEVELYHLKDAFAELRNKEWQRNHPPKYKIRDHVSTEKHDCMGGIIVKIEHKEAERLGDCMFFDVWLYHILCDDNEIRYYAEQDITGIINEKRRK